MATDWQSSACILCSINCGIDVQAEGGRLAKIRGDRSHPTSRGYLCQKATRLDHYQNHARRLRRPLRRRRDGTFEAIDWQTATRPGAWYGLDAGVTGLYTSTELVDSLRSLPSVSLVMPIART